jgi:hypothetical protein
MNLVWRNGQTICFASPGSSGSALVAAVAVQSPSSSHLTDRDHLHACSFLTRYSIVYVTVFDNFELGARQASDHYCLPGLEELRRPKQATHNVLVDANHNGSPLVRRRNPFTPQPIFPSPWPSPATGEGTGFQSQMAEAMDGFGAWDLDAFLWGEWHGDSAVGDWTKARPPRLGVVDKLRRKRHLSVEEFVYLRSRTTRTPKVTLPSPSLSANLWSRDVSGGVYPSLEGFLPDVAQILREEVEELTRLGATTSSSMRRITRYCWIPGPGPATNPRAGGSTTG